MKLKSLLAIAFAAIFFAGGASAKSLVVYFSRAGENYAVGNISEGNTAIIAKMIAAKTGEDIVEIIVQKDYPENYKACTEVAKDEQNKKARPALKNKIDISAYDTIYLGYPIWWGVAAWPVENFVKKNDFTGKTIIPFCTSYSSPLGDSDKLLAELNDSGEWKDGVQFSQDAGEGEILGKVKGF